MKRLLSVDATATNPSRRPKHRRRTNPPATAGKRTIKGRGWVA